MENSKDCPEKVEKSNINNQHPNITNDKSSQFSKIVGGNIYLVNLQGYTVIALNWTEKDNFERLENFTM